MPKGKWTKVVQALEKGDISAGKLNGITFNGKEVKIGETLPTPIAYYQGEDGNLVADSEQIVCGFNGAVPEYVKYTMNGCVRVYVKSAGDDGVERKIDQGMDVFTREWDASALDYKYTKIGMTVGVEGEFKYGDTSTDYGTISIKDPYAVPTKLDVQLDSNDKVLEATFAGYNMQLWSANIYLDCDAAGSYAGAEAMMKDSNQCTTMEFGSSQNWETSFVRGFLNGRSKPSGYHWTHAPNRSGQRSYTTQHSFIEKVAVNSDAMLQAVCSQVNRNWTSGDTIVRTTDRFWLPGCDLMKSADSRVTIINYYKDSVYGLCEETEFNNHVIPYGSMASYVNGCLGIGGNSEQWLRSAYGADSNPDYTDSVAYLDYRLVDQIGYAHGWNGLSPACTIG